MAFHCWRHVSDGDRQQQLDWPAGIMMLKKIEHKGPAHLRAALRNYQPTRKAKFGLETPTRSPSPGLEYLEKTDDRRRQSANGDSIETLTYYLGELPNEDVIGDSWRAVRAICSSGHRPVVRPRRSEVLLRPSVSRIPRLHECANAEIQREEWPPIGNDRWLFTAGDTCQTAIGNSS